jgi:hypothetical protein
VVYTNYAAPGKITQVIASSVEKPAIMVRGLSGQPLPVGSRVRFKRVSYSSNAVWPTESVLLVEPIDFSAAHNKK